MNKSSIAAVLLIGATSLWAASEPTTTREATAQEAKRFLDTTPKAMVIDVRSSEEYNEGHIKGATCINVLEADFQKKIATLDRKTPILVHCRSGGRSRRALAVMEKLQFQQIVHLTEGFNAWQAAGLPIEKSQPKKNNTP